MHWIDDIRNDIRSVKSSPKELKKFGLLIGCILILISGLAVWQHWWPSSLVIITAICGGVLVFLGILIPASLKIIHSYWIGFSIILGSIVSRIILFLLFYIVLTSLAGAAKLFNKRFSFSYKDKKLTSYWINRENSKNINYERMG